jgi:uncharacterized damage-inducible protein DinB
MEHMDRSALLVLHDYNTYANALVLKAAEALDETAFTARSSPSHGTVQGLLTHMARVEAGFLYSCSGPAVGKIAESPALAEIVEIFDLIAAARRSYLADIPAADLDEQITMSMGGKPLKLARWQLLAQSLVHSIHHRGELSIVMTALGQPLPTLDIILQFVNESGQEWPWE